MIEVAYDIGTARGVIEMEYNGRGVGQARTDLEGLQATGQRTQQQYNDASKTMAKAGLAIGAALAGGVAAAANFEQRMSAVGAVSGASAAELDQLRDKALQLGKDTAFSASESAAAMEELVKAGLSVSDVLNGAADATVALAAAGEVDMATAATIASNAMNQFNLKAEDMANVADKIAGAANASAIDVNDFGQSLTQAGAVANLAGVSFDDLTTAIGLMGNAGIKGSDAGTSLKTMLSNLQPTTEKQINLMKDLGLLTEDGANKFYDAQGSLKSLSDVSGILQKSLKGLTDAQKQQALETIFGSDAIRAAAVLADNGSKGFDKMAKSIDKVKAADVAKARLDNFKGSLEQLKGSLETVAIQIGTPLMNALRVVVDALTVLIGKFLDLPAPLQQAIGIFAAVLSGGLLLAAGLLKIKAALIAFRAGALLITGPIGLIVAAIAAAVAAFVYFYKTNEGFRNFVQKAGQAIKEFLGNALERLVPLVKAAIPHLISAGKAVAQWLTTAFEKAWPVIKRFADIIVNDVLPAVKDFAGTALKALGDAWAQIQPKIKPAIDAVAGFATTLGSVLLPVIKFVGQALIWWYQILLSNILPIVMKVVSFFVSVFGPMIGGIISGIITVFTGLLTFLQGLINFVVGVFTGDWGQAWEGIKQIVSGVISVIVGIFQVFWSQVKAGFGALWSVLKGAAGAAWGAIKAIVSGAIKGLWGFIKGVVGGIRDTMVSAWNAIKSRTVAIFQGIVSAVQGKIQDLMGKVRNIKSQITGFFSGAATWLRDAGVKIVQGLIGGIESMVEKAKGALKKVTGGLGKLLPGSPVKEGPLRVLNRGYAGRQIVGMIIDGIEDMRPMLEMAMSDPLGSFAAPSAGVIAGPTVAVEAGSSGGARIVSGTLSLDPSGRAFINGVAVDADDRVSGQNDTIGRMNR